MERSRGHAALLSRLCGDLSGSPALIPLSSATLCSCAGRPTLVARPQTGWRRVKRTVNRTHGSVAMLASRLGHHAGFPTAADVIKLHLVDSNLINNSTRPRSQLDPGYSGSVVLDSLVRYYFSFFP